MADLHFLLFATPKLYSHLHITAIDIQITQPAGEKAMQAINVIREGRIQRGLHHALKGLKWT